MQAITAAQMAELDRIMIEEFGIDVPIMMEHAAMATALVAAKLCEGKNIAILCGHGNNGGDGIAAARHLGNWGFNIAVAVAAAKDKLKPDPLKHANILEKMNIPVSYDSSTFEDADLIIDALLGYNLEGNPRGSYKALIDLANGSGKKILAVDIPSGLDATTGKAAEPCIRATATVALSIAKTGLLKEQAKQFVGKLFVSYMTVPDAVYERVGAKNPFRNGSLILEENK